MRFSALIAYAVSIAAANLLTTWYGLVPVAPGLTTTAGTYAAGAALLLRDAVQDLFGRCWALVGILAATALTAAVSPNLALASATAFLVAELADMAVYTPLRARGWTLAVLASGSIGAIVDTLLFLWIAQFPISAPVVAGQLVGKVVWATVLPIAAVAAVRQVRRAVPRHALGA